MGDRADPARRDRGQQGRRLRVEAELVGLDEAPARAPGGVDHRLHVRRGRGERLLAEHVLAGGQGVEGQPGVGGVDGADVDGVDVGVGEDLGVAGAGRGGQAVLEGEGRRPGGVGAADGDEDAAPAGGQLGEELPGDDAGAQDGPAEGGGSGHGASSSVGTPGPRVGADVRRR